jgi:hypothetical protein
MSRSKQLQCIQSKHIHDEIVKVNCIVDTVKNFDAITFIIRQYAIVIRFVRVKKVQEINDSNRQIDNQCISGSMGFSIANKG